MNQIPTPAHHAMTAVQSFSVGDRVFTASLAKATIVAIDATSGQASIKSDRCDLVQTVEARHLFKIAGTIGERVPA